MEECTANEESQIGYVVGRHILYHAFLSRTMQMYMYVRSYLVLGKTLPTAEEEFSLIFNIHKPN
jgi:hypothetical protein